MGKMPISEAVNVAIETNGPLIVNIRMADNLRGRVCEVGLVQKFGKWDIDYRDGAIATSGGWTEKTRADAASALRAIADQLAPDVEKKALKAGWLRRSVTVLHLQMGNSTLEDEAILHACGILIGEALTLEHQARAELEQQAEQKQSEEGEQTVTLSGHDTCMLCLDDAGIHPPLEIVRASVDGVIVPVDYWRYYASANTIKLIPCASVQKFPIGGSIEVVFVKRQGAEEPSP